MCEEEVKAGMRVIDNESILIVELIIPFTQLHVHYIKVLKDPHKHQTVHCQQLECVPSSQLSSFQIQLCGGGLQGNNSNRK